MPVFEPIRKVTKLLCVTQRGKGGGVSSTSDLRAGMGSSVCMEASWIIKLTMVLFFPLGVDDNFDNDFLECV